MGRWQEQWWPGDPTADRRRFRQGCRYCTYIPDPLVDLELSLSGELTADISDAERNIEHLNAETPKLANLETLARLLLRAESVASSRIEGLEVGPRRLAKYEAAQLAHLTDARDRTAAAVLGNIRTMGHAVDVVARRSVVTVDDLVEVQRLLFEGTPDAQYGGALRTMQNWIGGNAHNPCGADFVPPPPEHVGELLDDLCRYINDDRHPPLVQAALAHAQFETIHPFVDGNGRVGRALIHIVWRRRGLTPRYVPPVSLILATNAHEYVRGLTEFRRDTEDSAVTSASMEQWIEIFTAACLRACQDAENFAQQVEQLEGGWRERLGRVRADSSVDRLLRLLPAAPIVTIQTAAEMIQRSEQKVGQAVQRMQEAGVLNQVTIGRRNRAFEAAGLLDALTSFERALATPTGDTRTSDPARHVPARPNMRHG